MTDQEKLTSQWITSLAISVVCCAALFLVFAGYIIDLSRASSNNDIRLIVLQERQDRMLAELDALRRPIPVMVTNQQGQQQAQPGQQPAAQQPAAQEMPPPANSAGVEPAKTPQTAPTVPLQDIPIKAPASKP